MNKDVVMNDTAMCRLRLCSVYSWSIFASCSDGIAYGFEPQIGSILPFRALIVTAESLGLGDGTFSWQPAWLWPWHRHDELDKLVARSKVARRKTDDRRSQETKRLAQDSRSRWNDRQMSVFGISEHRQTS
mmetsp:Transcript_6285/g.19606  ORF Transcript_6285/g.19606 Transcript_6285/m.19606 type:complete len:131 (+) Transcript_6285:948-1340(+)